MMLYIKVQDHTNSPTVAFEAQREQQRTGQKELLIFKFPCIDIRVGENYTTKLEACP